MITTPRTDAAAGYVIDSDGEHLQAFDHSPDGPYVPTKVARELEDENARLRAFVAKVSGDTVEYGHYGAGTPTLFAQEATKLMQRIDAARKAKP